MKLYIKVQPKASKERIEKQTDNSYKAYVYEAASKGKANKRLIELLAEHFDTKKHKIRILHGTKSRNKIIELQEN